jgi:outer membrane protein with beta-barrel domain
MQLRMLRIAVVVLFGCHHAATAHAQFYAGVLGGVSTLSGDSRSLLSPGSSAFSSYDPKNGGVATVLVGKHFSDYFSAQASYVWNGNELTLTAANFNNGMQQGYQEQRSSSQQSVIGDLLVYFRSRNSRLRPYLSIGTGFVHLASTEERLEQVVGAPVLPQQRFSSNSMVLHVPVGMDVNLGKGWALRYTFSETISKNPISDRLSPPGQHRLMNFQNLFGFVKRF